MLFWLISLQFTTRHHQVQMGPRGSWDLEAVETPRDTIDQRGNINWWMHCLGQYPWSRTIELSGHGTRDETWKWPAPQFSTWSGSPLKFTADQHNDKGSKKEKGPVTKNSKKVIKEPKRTCLATAIRPGADIEASDPENYNRRAIHWSARNGHVNVVARLLNAGVDPESREDRGWTPLHLCCFHGHKDVALLLIGRGVSIDAKDDKGTTPLMALWWLLWQAGVPLVISTTRLGTTHFTGWNRHTKVCLFRIRCCLHSYLS